jgi:hypothetical protein
MDPLIMTRYFLLLQIDGRMMFRGDSMVVGMNGVSMLGNQADSEKCSWHEGNQHAWESDR